MVEIIKESNDNLNKNLFLKELAEKDDGVKLQITRISDAIPSNRNKKDDFIYMDFEVLDDFVGRFTLNNNGTVKDETANINGDIIAIAFTLNEVDMNGNYTIGKGKNLFNILNYGMKEKNMIPESNKNSIKCSYKEIKSALLNLKFIATAKLVESKDFNDYLRLEVKTR